MSAEAIGTISRIDYYPIKSAGSLSLGSAKLTEAGIAGDREFMIVRAEPNGEGVNEFITQRDRRDKNDRMQGLSDLTKIVPWKLYPDELCIGWEGEPEVVIVPMDVDTGKELSVKIWDDVVKAVDQGDKLANWLSEHLDLKVRLVKAAGGFERYARQNYMPNGNKVRFQDGYPVHWFFQESVDELSQIAGEKIPYEVFRPNIVVKGSAARTEHELLSGEIAGIPFLNPKPVDRCPVTNVDQKTGELKPGRALTPLSTYKKWRNTSGKQKVIFGENMLPLTSGEINVGDEVVLTERRTSPLVYGAKV